MPSDIEKNIVESLYNVTIDPANYDEFLQQLDQDFFDIPDELNIEDYKNIDYQPQKLNHSIENHFFRAMAILDLIGKHKNGKPTIQQIVEADPLPAFILDVKGKLILSNPTLNSTMGNDFNPQITELQFTNDSATKLSEILKQLETAPQKTALGMVQLKLPAVKTPPDFILSKIYDHKTKQSFLHGSALQTSWNDDKNTTIKELYQLTNSELDIAKRLFSGDKISDMAAHKNRSIYTIRTQVRAIFRKTNLKTQSELIKLFATIQAVENEPENYVAEQYNQPKSPLILAKQDHQLIRADHRKLYYEIYGQPNGRPVLFLHGMISGTKMTQNIINLLRKQNIKLICPHRAGFGYSDVNPEVKNLDNFINDMHALLDQEKVKTCSIIGHHDGGYYAYLLGAKNPERFSLIRNINSCVPIKTAKQLNEASPRQRITAYIALYTPKLLPFILGAGIAQVRKNGAASMMNALFKNSASDMAMLADEEIGEIMINGFESCIANGIESFVNDMTNVISGNWSDLIEDCQVPIEIFHAKDEHVVPISQVYDMVKSIPKLKLAALEGGQIILYKYPELFFADL